MSGPSESFVHVRSRRFPVLEGEREELVNEGTFGKALALYLKERLSARGWDAPFVCCEDWGWWCELRGAPFSFGVCVYSAAGPGEPSEFACAAGTTPGRRWSWSRLRFVDPSPWIERLHADLLSLFGSDPEVELLGITEEFPL